MSLPSISALVVSFHTGPRLHECLYALLGDPDVDEIVIVDNGNPGQEIAWLERFSTDYPKAKLLSGGGNVGFGAGVNAGAKEASGEVLLIINPDAVLRRGSIAPLVDAMNGRPSPCIVGGKIFGVNGQEERGGRRNTLTLASALGLAKWTLEDEPLPEGPIAVGAISGAFFALSRPDFDSLQGFDEEYFLHVEDVDLCRRALEAGGSVIFQPLAGALHYTSTSDVPSPVVVSHKAASLKRYFRKFAKGSIERFVLACAFPFIGLALRLRG